MLGLKALEGTYQMKAIHWQYRQCHAAPRKAKIDHCFLQTRPHDFFGIHQYLRDGKLIERGQPFWTQQERGVCPPRYRCMERAFGAGGRGQCPVRPLGTQLEFSLLPVSLESTEAFRLIENVTDWGFFPEFPVTDMRRSACVHGLHLNIDSRRFLQHILSWRFRSKHCKIGNVEEVLNYMTVSLRGVQCYQSLPAGRPAVTGRSSSMGYGVEYPAVSPFINTFSLQAGSSRSSPHNA